ncbi:MAG: 5-(carboxyamino)imidazole ribonucleotide synthase [Pirellulales bacterium]
MSDSQILPGGWLGVLGGGQLGRMFAQAAHRLGYHVAVFEPEANSPAAQAADRHFCSTSSAESELDLVSQLSKLCSAVTLEFENIDANLVREAQQHTLTRPGVDFLEICQDRKREKESVAKIGCPTTPFRAVSTFEQARQAAEELGWPVVLKTARSGYDGKGQRIVKRPEDLSEAWDSLNSDHVVAEKWIDFVAEVSMIAARNARGQFVCYPVFENQHANHILDVTCCPARGDLCRLQSEAESICRSVAEQYSVEGLFCIEFFVTRDGKLMVNEMAPRPHNSGHLTIEAFDISQFELQVRAICNLPLRQPQQIMPAAMVNLLGDVWSGGTPNWSAALERERTYLHLYGKSQPRPGRKMGHITLLDNRSPVELVKLVRQSLTVSRV